MDGRQHCTKNNPPERRINADLEPTKISIRQPARRKLGPKKTDFKRDLGWECVSSLTVELGIYSVAFNGLVSIILISWARDPSGPIEATELESTV